MVAPVRGGRAVRGGGHEKRAHEPVRGRAPEPDRRRGRPGARRDAVDALLFLDTAIVKPRRKKTRASSRVFFLFVRGDGRSRASNRRRDVRRRLRRLATFGETTATLERLRVVLRGVSCVFSAVPPGADTVARRRVRGRRMRVARGRASACPPEGIRDPPRVSHRDVSNATPTSHARPTPSRRSPKRRNAETAETRFRARAFASLMDAQKSAEVRTGVLRVARARGAWRWTLEAGTAPGPAARAEGFDDAAARGARRQGAGGRTRTASPARRGFGRSASAARGGSLTRRSRSTRRPASAVGREYAVRRGGVRGGGRAVRRGARRPPPHDGADSPPPGLDEVRRLARGSRAARAARRPRKKAVEKLAAARDKISGAAAREGVARVAAESPRGGGDALRQKTRTREGEADPGRRRRSAAGRRAGLGGGDWRWCAAGDARAARRHAERRWEERLAAAG